MAFMNEFTHSIMLRPKGQVIKVQETKKQNKSTVM